MDNVMNIQLVEQRVTVLQIDESAIVMLALIKTGRLTLETDAVNTTTSYSSPTLFMN